MQIMNKGKYAKPPSNVCMHEGSGKETEGGREL